MGKICPQSATRVAELTEIAVIREFCEFIVSGLGEKTLPDYATIDMIKVPRLAPNMFVHDYRDGIEQGLLVKFSGTAIDEHYGRVLQGRYVEENYTGSDGPDHYFPLPPPGDRRTPAVLCQTVHSVRPGKRKRTFQAIDHTVFPLFLGWRNGQFRYRCGRV